MIIIQNESFVEESEFETDAVSEDSSSAINALGSVADADAVADAAAVAALPEFSFRRHLFSMIPDIRKYTLWMVFIFVLSLACGYLFGFYTPSFFEMLSDYFHFPEYSAFDFLLFIFFNNVKVAGLLVFLGCLFAVLPILIVFSNGFLIGIVSESIIRTNGLFFLLVGLLPHGIIELPIILISAGIGFKMGVGTLQVIFQKKSIRLFLFDFLAAIILFVIVIVPLLFAAAMIEVYVTGFLLDNLFS